MPLPIITPPFSCCHFQPRLVENAISSIVGTPKKGNRDLLDVLQAADGLGDVDEVVGDTLGVG